MSFDPLTTLLVDAEGLDREAIASAIRDRVGIDGANGRLTLLSGYDELDARRKLTVLLLAKKAACLLDLVADESMTYKEAVSASGLAEGTVAPMLRSLKEQRVADQTSARAYFVPTPYIKRAITFLRLGSATNG